MRNPFVPRVGGVLSADIAVPDHERELAFYSSILTTGDAPLWRDDLMNNLGIPIIGLGVRTPEYDSLPLQWMPHFQVADVATSAARTVELGGKEIMHGKGEDGQSQWAVLSDQVGAAFGVVPVVDEASGYTVPSGRCGRVVWLSLNVPDATPSHEFYQRVLGWKARSNEMLIDDETVAAEIFQACDNAKSIPSVWLIHLPVGDLVESLRRVRDGGGEVLQECEDGKSAVIRDLVGVCIALRDAS
jgi:predicted enzyme related to lactoylglutathione lyase